jgi:transcriptional regulator with XRE-family HTH domain
MAESERRQAFADFVQQRLKDKGWSMRRFSDAIGKDPSWLSQLLLGRRGLPTPDECRVIAEVLDVPLTTLLEIVWEVDPAELSREIETVAAHPDDEVSIADLSDQDRATIRDFIGYVRAKAKMRQQEESNGSGEAR